MILKEDYEACFKEGFRLGFRLTRSKMCYYNARNAEGLGDKEMAQLERKSGAEWSALAKNCGRKFTPIAAHEPNQPMLDIGDAEKLIHDTTEPFKRRA
jgi:hypothetical protein